LELRYRRYLSRLQDLFGPAREDEDLHVGGEGAGSAQSSHSSDYSDSSGSSPPINHADRDEL
jgi:hypothetical protein